MSKFQPGQQKSSKSGRKKGTPNKKTKVLSHLLNEEELSIPGRLLEILPQLTVEKQADVLLGLMPYIYPKKKAIEISPLESDKYPEKITIEVVESPYKLAKTNP